MDENEVKKTGRWGRKDKKRRQGSYMKSENESETHSVLSLCDPMDYTVHEIHQNTGVDSLSLLHGIFPT